ncbi:DUF4129 domain-containing protein [Streptomyces spiramenti]|uniref:DUF4129 domain-containing protein n=1 Tax=Streptomyces spiramenti TaxID=2720606 RepID=A0ABX1AG97_9ACTN|nr:DUF4129 domain-containing protein [Streptomyces spiramenti]NJP66173.1 DUF4129 domain-containing protein [Streptomyces spiramenti]
MTTATAGVLLAVLPRVVPVDTDREAAREAARRELSRQIYADHRPGPLRQAFDWVWEQLGKLLSVAFAPGGWLGVIILVGVAVALLIALRLRLGRLRTGKSRPGDADVFGDTTRTAAEYRAAADAHAASGAWREAVRDRMRALVRSLEERTLLDARPGRTADEAATEAGTVLPELADRMRAAARLFDAVTYGDAPAAEDDHRRLLELDDTVRRTRPSLAGPSTPPGGAPFAGAPR